MGIILNSVIQKTSSQSIIHDQNLKSRENLEGVNKLSLVTVAFEKFVIYPWQYLGEIEKRLDTFAGNKTSKVMKMY